MMCKVEKVDYEAHEVSLSGDVEPGALVGSTISFVSGDRVCNYEIFAAKRDEDLLTLSLGDVTLLEGRALVKSVKGGVIETDTVMALEAVGPVHGLTLTDKSGTLCLKVNSVGGGQIEVDGTLPDVSGEDVYIWDVGVGDQAIMDPFCLVEIQDGKVTKLESNVNADVRLR